MVPHSHRHDIQSTNGNVALRGSIDDVEAVYTSEL